MGRYLASLCFLTAIFRLTSCSSVSLTINAVSPTVNPETIEWVDASTNNSVNSFPQGQLVKLRYTCSGNGIKITDLKACATADCLTFTADLLDANGCPHDYVGFGSVIPTGFVRIPGTKMYETDPFDMFHWENQIPMYLGGKKEICDHGGAECDDACDAFVSGRRKRDTHLGNRTRVLEVMGTNGKPTRLVFGEESPKGNEKHSKEQKDVVETKKIFIDIKEYVDHREPSDKKTDHIQAPAVEDDNQLTLDENKQDLLEISSPEESCLEDSFALPSVAVMGSLTGAACAMAGFLSYQVQAVKRRGFSLKA